MWTELEQHTNQEVGRMKWMNPALFFGKANTQWN
jgi:hypothetical protein